MMGYLGYLVGLVGIENLHAEIPAWVEFYQMENEILGFSLRFWGIPVVTTLQRSHHVQGFDQVRELHLLRRLWSSWSDPPMACRYRIV